MGTTTKLYIEFPRNTFMDFSSLSMVFLTFFQLPTCYEMGIELLTLLRESTSTHIVLRISHHYKSRNDSLVPIGHKDRFLLLENRKNEMEMQVNRTVI